MLARARDKFDLSEFAASILVKTSRGSNTPVALMEDPILVSASNSFKAIPERKFSVYEESSVEGLSKWTKNNWAYVFQLEYATIGLAFVDVTSVAHIDSPNIVDVGLSQSHMSTRVIGHNLDAELDVQASTGLVTPACFDRTSRCLDEIVRRIRVTASYEDPSWSGKLLETYDTQTDQFRIASCCWYNS
ncbi:hypothetical protein CFP56_034232 [Quercus suber]|uniref:Uncharacterized protein n=1 Tax=Quercus suber TaxID=58331 RepID=A0AAW0JEI7_QUESU